MTPERVNAHIQEVVRLRQLLPSCLFTQLPLLFLRKRHLSFPPPLQLPKLPASLFLP